MSNKEKLSRMKLPSYLNALRAFEASARNKSFSVAANELNVTPAAVGQLVRGLEEWLGFSLFHRNSSGKERLIVTDQAKRALPIIRDGFEKLSLGFETLQTEAVGGALTVTVSPAFATKWLMPRIYKFQANNSEIDVRLDISLKLLDFLSNNIDIGVRYGNGSWPGLTSELLMHEEIYPVCSPALLLKDNSLVTNVATFDNQTLIHDISLGDNTQFVNWSKWFAKAGVTASTNHRGMQINNSAAVLQAAIEGQGIALARSAMVEGDIASGRLIRLLPNVGYTSELSYYIVYRSDRIDVPKISAFRDWLIGEIQIE